MLLVVLAAGIGRRFGGLKQLAEVGPSGEPLLAYSVYDAVRAGFRRVVFVIRREILAEFDDVLGARVRRMAEVEYAFQDLDRAPAGRTKPWGSAHALLAARGSVAGPFALVNCDDFYGAASYAGVAGFLRGADPAGAAFCMVGFTLRDTLPARGAVSRGVCETTPDGLLKSIVEMTGVRRAADGGVTAQEGQRAVPLRGDEPASMNMWGFTPAIFDCLGSRFERFLRELADPLQDELYLPTCVNEMVAAGTARVTVLGGGGPWFGMTHREDVETVRAGVSALVARGVYPDRIFVD